jgi:hypothetical protein
MIRSAWLSILILAFLALAFFLSLNGCGAPASATASYALSATALNPPSVSAGASSASTITVTPANGPGKGYTGSVFLSCSSVPEGNAAPICSFSENPVAISSSAPVTSALMVLTSGNTPVASYVITVTGSDASNSGPSNGAQALSLKVVSASSDTLL